jgi:uncharacterized membrane protein
MQNPPGSYPPNQGYQPGGFQTPGGYPPSGPVSGKTQTLGLEYNIAAGLCYVPCIALIAAILWIATEPKTSKFVRFHAFQSLFLGIFGIVFGIGLWIVMIAAALIGAAISESLVAIFSIVIGLAGFAIGIGLFVVVVMCLIKAFGGQYWKAPIIGNLAEKYSS